MKSKRYQSSSSTKTQRSGFIFSKFGITVIAVIVVVIVAVATLGAGPPYPIISNLFDTTAPYFVGMAPQNGEVLSLNANSMPFEVGDDGTGIRSASIKCGDVSVFNYENAAGQHRIKFDQLDIEKLPEGILICQMLADDNSWFKHELKLDFSLIVDHAAPTVSIVSLQPFATAGGIELIIYEAKDSGGIAVTGARTIKTANAEGTAAVGVKLSRFDPQYTYPDDLYGALLPLRHDLAQAPIQVEVFVRDLGGNEMSAITEFPVRAIKRPQVKPQLSENFLATRVPPLFQEFKKLSSDPKVTTSELPSPSEQFRLVNTEYRKLLAIKLHQIFTESPNPEKRWNIPFSRPVAGSTTSVFGEEREYFFKQDSAGFSLHEGLDLASVKQDEVVAVAPGKVVFCDSLGIYGEAIIIDHGGQVMSLYGHLSSFSVKVGDLVSQGHAIAKSGSTGLAGGDHLHFETRVNGVSVSPLEWWDSKWFNDNIELKLAQVRVK